eukprot:TRINITY_DN246_c0_g1_i2.p1 TRINITY_DN246_c0_g1~~TRINITY_DN246_c0_g1_i2.p1  ORF type:complete len:638 (-),score=204.89 TRINITY_DN246_c0_g1_i2:202-2115(-)
MSTPNNNNTASANAPQASTLGTSTGTITDSPILSSDIFHEGDVITLRKYKGDGLWKVEVNGHIMLIRIPEVQIKRVANEDGKSMKKRTSMMSLIGKRKSKSKLLGEPKIEVVPEGSNNAGTPSTPTSSTSVSDDYEKYALDKQQKKKTMRKSMMKIPSLPAKLPNQARLNAQQDLRDLREEIELLRVDIDLLIKTVGEVNPETMEDPVLSKVAKLTPNEALLEKMLSNAFQVTLNGETKSVVLADQPQLRWRDLLIPSINLNSYSATEKLKLTTLEFNLFPYKDVEQGKMEEGLNHLFGLVIHMFHELGLIKEFRIPETTLWRFVFACSRRYRAVPFHSFYHAFNVTQTLYHFLTGCGAAKAFGSLELLAMIIATMCHDMDHPGLNNDFQRKAHTRIAQLHKKSILENHHYLQAMGILAKDEFNILINMPSEQGDQVLLYVRDLILATDLSMHGLVINKLKERQKVVSRLLQKQNCHLLLDQEDKILLMCSLVKCADLSNEIREQSLAKQWAKLVLVEFFKQADTEKELKLETAAFMDRSKIIISKEQLNFIEKLCMPLYTATVAIFPKMDKCIKQMQSNRDEWDRLLNSFFVDKSTLSNQSIWEGDKKEKTPEGQNLSTTLASRASNSLKPSTKKK